MTAPDIPYMASTGEQTTLNNVRKRIAIVAFTKAPDDACCRLDPRLVKLGERFRNASITVAQVSLPTGECPHGHDCVDACQMAKAPLVALCDTDRIAWDAFGRPKADTAFLIKSSKVIAIRSLNDLQSIRVKAEELDKDLHRGGWPVRHKLRR